MNTNKGEKETPPPRPLSGGLGRLGVWASSRASSCLRAARCAVTGAPTPPATPHTFDRGDDRPIPARCIRGDPRCRSGSSASPHPRDVLQVQKNVICRKLGFGCDPLEGDGLHPCPVSHRNPLGMMGRFLRPIASLRTLKNNRSLCQSPHLNGSDFIFHIRAAFGDHTCSHLRFLKIHIISRADHQIHGYPSPRTIPWHRSQAVGGLATIPVTTPREPLVPGLGARSE